MVYRKYIPLSACGYAAASLLAELMNLIESKSIFLLIESSRSAHLPRDVALISPGIVLLFVRMCPSYAATLLTMDYAGTISTKENILRHTT